MPNVDGKIVPLLFWRMQDHHAGFDWGKEVDAAFQCGQLIEAMVQEAGAKGMTVVVQVALWPTEELFPPGTDGAAETPKEESAT